MRNSIFVVRLAIIFLILLSTASLLAQEESVKNVLTNGNEILHGTNYPLNGDRALLCVVTAVSDTEATGYKIWDMAATKTLFTARRLTEQRIAVGQKVLFYRLASEYVVYVPSPGVLFVRDNGYGSGQECDQAGNIAPGTPTLPLVATDPLARFYNNAPPWKYGRIYPGWRFGNKYVVWMQGVGSVANTLIASQITTGSEYVDLELDTDSAGRIADFRALDLLAFCVYKTAGADVYGTEYKSGSWTTVTSFGNNADATLREYQLRSRHNKALFCYLKSGRVASRYYDGASWQAEIDIDDADDEFIGCAVGKTKAYLAYEQDTGTNNYPRTRTFDLATQTYSNANAYSSAVFNAMSETNIVANANDYCLLQMRGEDTATNAKLLVLRAKAGNWESSFTDLGNFSLDESGASGTLRSKVGCAINENDDMFVFHSHYDHLTPIFGYNAGKITLSHCNKNGAWQTDVVPQIEIFASDSSEAPTVAASKQYACAVGSYWVETESSIGQLSGIAYKNLSSGAWAWHEITGSIYGLACDDLGKIHLIVYANPTWQHIVCDNGVWQSPVYISVIGSFANPRLHASRSGKLLFTWNRTTTYYYNFFDGSAWLGRTTLATGAPDATSFIR